jgi:Domain of unknown function (DUF4331)
VVLKPFFSRFKSSAKQADSSAQNPKLRYAKLRWLQSTPVRLGVMALAIATFASAVPKFVQSSDHDDGEVDTKGRNLNLTDLYVFREQDQNPGASANDLVLIMNTNPRSVARQQYYFSTRARYEFKIARAANKDANPAGVPDAILRFEFGAPDANMQQDIKITTIIDGNTSTATGKTTPLKASSQPIINPVSVGGGTMAVFAGLREDPFFFDVEQYFRVRAGALGIGPAVGFRPASSAIDFAKGYNVNAIAVRVPISLLGGNAKVLDVWETISVGAGAGKFTQVERLARPAINEGLVVTNDFLNALNSVGPDFEAAALAGQQPAATIAGPIVGEVKKTLLAVGNNDARANALIGAFLPDVMRIDTTGASGYANDLNAKGSPVRGRLLKDDVIDITLSVVTNGAITSDNVSYEGTPGSPSQGHNPLVSSFPYLALPN